MCTAPVPKPLYIQVPVATLSMPRKKSEATESNPETTEDSTVVESKKTGRRASKTKSESDQTMHLQTESSASDVQAEVNGKPVGKLDSLDFYMNQLKLEGLESRVAETNQKATTISHQIMEVLKTEKGMDGEIADSSTDSSTDNLFLREDEFDRTQEKIEDLYKRLEDTQMEKDALNHEITKLRDDLTRKYHDSRIASDNPKEGYGIIIRASETTFTSSLFHDGNYDVRLARDGSYIKFKPDVEGRASCVNETIRIPLLGTYLPFNGTREFGVIPINSNTLMIRL